MQWDTGLMFEKAVSQTWCKLLTPPENLFRFDTVLWKLQSYLVPAASLLPRGCGDEDSSAVVFVQCVGAVSLSRHLWKYTMEPGTQYFMLWFCFLGRYSWDWNRLLLWQAPKFCIHYRYITKGLEALGRGVPKLGNFVDSKKKPEWMAEVIKSKPKE